MSKKPEDKYAYQFDGYELKVYKELATSRGDSARRTIKAILTASDEEIQSILGSFDERDR